MKKTSKFFGFILLMAVIGLVITGCAGFIFGGGTLTIRSDGNLSSVRPGGTLRFSSSTRGIVWMVSSTSDGAGPVANGTYISADGMLTVAINETSVILYIIVTVTETGNSESKQVRVTTVSNVAINPVNQSVRRGSKLQFNASVSGSNSPDNAATWKVSSNAAGTGVVTPGTGINASGVLTVAANETLPALYIIGTSVVDPSKSGSTVVNIIIPIVNNVAVSPSNQSVPSGGAVQFYASVTGTNDPDNAVTWRVSSNAAGTGAVAQGTTINANGVLTLAPNETAPALYVFANSVEDPTKSGSVIVTVIVPIVSGVVVSSGSQSVPRGGTVQFNASVTGTNNPSNAVTWRVSSNAAGTGAVTPGTTINANGVLTVAANENAATLYVFANSAADPSKFGNIAVNVIIPANPTVTSVAVRPAGQSVNRGGTLQFNAMVTGTNNPGNAVTWRVSSNTAGTGAVTPGTSINASGVLTVSANETNTTLYVIATSTADTTKSGGAAVTVIIPASPTVTSVTVRPAGQSVNRGGTLQFNAMVAGANNPGNAVTWRVSSNTAGTGAVTPGTSINASGVLTVSANETNTTLYVIATSTADTTKSGGAAVTVIIPASPTVTSVTVSPGSQTVNRGGTLQFNASVTGTNNPSTAVTWRVSSNAGGTGSVASGTSINASGVLTVSANETNTTLYVIATATADTTKSGRATITVPAPVITPAVTGVSISPTGRSMNRGGTLQFNASVTGTNNPSTAVTWRVSSNAAGTGAVTSGTSINASGLLTVSSNETNATLYVIATSTADSTKSGTTSVSVIRSSGGNQNDQGQDQQ